MFKGCFFVNLNLIFLAIIFPSSISLVISCIDTPLSFLQMTKIRCTYYIRQIRNMQLIAGRLRDLSILGSIIVL